MKKIIRLSAGIIASIMYCADANLPFDVFGESDQFVIPAVKSTKETKKGNEISEEQYNKLLLGIYALTEQCTKLENRLAKLELIFAKHTHTYSVMAWGNKQTYLQTERPSDVSQKDILKLLQKQATVNKS